MSFDVDITPVTCPFCDGDGACSSCADCGELVPFSVAEALLAQLRRHESMVRDLASVEKLPRAVRAILTPLERSSGVVREDA